MHTHAFIAGILIAVNRLNRHDIWHDIYLYSTDVPTPKHTNVASKQWKTGIFCLFNCIFIGKWNLELQILAKTICLFWVCTGMLVDKLVCQRPFLFHFNYIIRQRTICDNSVSWEIVIFRIPDSDHIHCFYLLGIHINFLLLFAFNNEKYESCNIHNKSSE